MSKIVSVIDHIRSEAMGIGYDAYNAKAVVINPYPATSNYHDAWQDGYDLGVLTAINDSDVSLVLPENFLVEDIDIIDIPSHFFN